MSRNNAKWDGGILFKHGGSYQPYWWISSRMINYSSYAVELYVQKIYTFFVGGFYILVR